jgi:hypothetical protein
MIRLKNFFDNRIIAFFIIIAFLFAANPSIAQAPVLKTSVDRKDILIGEQLNYNVEAVFPSGKYVVTWLSIPDSTDHIEVVTRGRIDTTENNGIITFKQSLALTSFDSGRQTIPQFVVNFDPLKDDSTLNLFTDSLKINVGYSPLDSTKTFHDIKTIIDVKYIWPLWYYLAAADLLLLLVVIILLLIKLLKKKKKPQDIFNSPLSPYDEALKLLSEVKGDQLLVKGEAKQFHVRLTEIFKRYLSRKTKTNLFTLTSGDLLIKLNQMNVSKGHISVIANNLRLNDAVKFAKYQPPINDSEDILVNTKNMIEQLEELLNHQTTVSK